MLKAPAIVVALVLAAWFAVSAVATRDADRAAAVLSRSGRIGAVDAARVASLLRGASRLNPDREVTLLRARLALEQGDRRGAERLVARVTAAEPDNLEAWALAVQAAPDAATFRRGEDRIRALVPDVVKHH